MTERGRNFLKSKGLSWLEIERLEHLPQLSDKTSQFEDSKQRSYNIVKEIRNEYSLTEELSILRKMIKKIADKLEIQDDEFETYNTKVEQIVKLTKE